MSGPPSTGVPRRWLLLRGLAREQRHWGEFPRIFQSASGAESVLCLDLPGTGTEHGRSSPGTIRGIMEDVRGRWIRARGQDVDGWGVVAISLGGMVAQEWARRYPGEFDAAVLINSSTADGCRPWQRIRPVAFVGGVKALLDSDRVNRERIVLRWTTRLIQDREAVARAWAAFANERPPDRISALSQLLAAARFVAPRSLDCPVLVVFSLSDEFTDPSCSRVIARRLGASWAAHPRAGHDLPLDDPEWLSLQIVQWANLIQLGQNRRVSPENA